MSRIKFKRPKQVNLQSPRAQRQSNHANKMNSWIFLFLALLVASEALPAKPPGERSFAGSVGKKGDKPMQQVLSPSSTTTVKPTSNAIGFSPVKKLKIGVIADLDTKSVVEGGKYFVAYLKKGTLNVELNKKNPELSKVSLDWGLENTTQTIKTGFSFEGRGLELSTLNVFNKKLYACGDKTGIVFELAINDTVKDITPIPWTILNAGSKGFKCEWATVKNDKLWIGGHGTGDDHRLLKQINIHGQVIHGDWSPTYDKIAKALNITRPGYVTNEAAAWSQTLKKWIVAPRKISAEGFDVKKDETKGSNIFLISEDEFDKIEVKTAGELVPNRGFSSVKFIPGTGDQLVVAIRSVEVGNVTESYIMVFDLKGNVVMREILFAKDKYEGIEFLP